MASLSSFAAFLLYLSSSVRICQSSIQTIPTFPNNVVTTGYTGLTLRAEFESGGNECRWNFERMHSVVIFSPDEPCTNRSDSSTCVETSTNSGRRIQATYTIMEPINTNLTITIGCVDGFRTQPINITVQECRSTSPFIVQSTAATFGSRGMFSCENEGTLVNPNQNGPAERVTTCLATGEWSGNSVLECWKAPSVTLTGQLSVLEGSSLSIACDYDDIYPAGNQTIFYFRGVTIVLGKGQKFEIQKVKREDNNRPIFCQAVTPFTKKFNETGRSGVHFINVTYAPHQEKPTKCVWTVNQTQICRVAFRATTEVKEIGVWKNGIQTENIITDLQKLPNDTMEFLYVQQNVEFATEGNYEVHLMSPVHPFNHTIEFEIEVIAEPLRGMTTNNDSSTDTSSFNYWIIIVVGVAVYAAVMTVISIVLCSKMRKIKSTLSIALTSKKTKKTAKDHSHYLQPMKDSVYHPANDIESLDEKIHPFSNARSFMVVDTSPRKYPNDSIAFSQSEASKVEYEEIVDYPDLSPKKAVPVGYEVMIPQKSTLRRDHEGSMLSSRI